LSNFHLWAKSIALTACFAALYVVFSLWNLFPAIGTEGKWINAAMVMAPLFGMILGPYFGVLSITIGSIAGTFFQLTGVFGPLSFMPHTATVFC
jgi:LytS/YehU family sensor histidine kinase